MTTIQVTDRTARTVSLTVGSRDLYVSKGQTRDQRINVLCKNASHHAYRGLGRFFDSWEEAIDAYKSGSIRLGIEHAKELLDGEQVEVTDLAGLVVEPAPARQVTIDGVTITVSEKGRVGHMEPNSNRIFEFVDAGYLKMVDCGPGTYGQTDFYLTELR